MTLFPLLQAQRMTSLWLNVYVDVQHTEDIDSVMNALRERVACNLGVAIAEQFDLLFSDVPDFDSTS